MKINHLVHLDLFCNRIDLIEGFGNARPVSVNPDNYKVSNADLYIPSAYLMMNFVLRVITTFMFWILAQYNIIIFADVSLLFLIKMFIIINFNLFLFNLIPLGPIDGNSVFPHFSPYNYWMIGFQHWSSRYGSYVLICLVLLSTLLPGFGVFRWISHISISITKGLL